MFMTDTAKANTKLKAFFKTWWNKELDSVKVGNRPNKPSITMGDQTTINNLVFEALGSDNNKEDFVLCEDEINGYKARMWKKVAPMQNRKYGDAVKDAVAGKSTSNIYLSGLRNVGYAPPINKTASNVALDSRCAGISEGSRGGFAPPSLYQKRRHGAQER